MEAEYCLDRLSHMYPGWVYVFRTRKQWMPPYVTIRVKPKKVIQLGVMDIAMEYVLVGVHQEGHGLL